MTTKTLSMTAPDTNYQNGTDWVGGVAPVAGDIVIISSLPQGGPVPITATGLAIVNQQITLQGIGALGAAGGSSFDAQTTLTGTTDSSAASFDGTFNSAATITNVALTFTSSGGAVPMFFNTGTITYNRAPISNPSFLIGTGNSSAIFSNTGTINVTNQPGGQLTGGTAYPTYLEISAPLSGTGVVNITGDHPNATAPTAYVGSQAKITVDGGSPVTGTETFNLNDGELELLSIGTGTVNFQDSTGILNFGSGVDVSANLNINGFRTGDVIGLGTSSVKAGTLSYNATTNILSFQDSSNGNALVNLHIVPTGTLTYTTASFAEMTGVGDFVQDQSIVTTSAVACYVRGTRILTVRGEVPIEELQIGDLVATFAGRGAPLRPIRWLGHRRLALRRHPDPVNTHPIHFRVGALSEGVPHRDLLVSPNHRMRVGNTLVTAVELVNGASIVQESPDEIEYWHIELDGHDLVLAEGVQAETYVDTGNRSAFENGAVVMLNPALDGDILEPCLPYAGVSSAVRERLIAQAELLGWTRSVDPAPWLEVDGKQIKPTQRGDRYRFDLPAGCRTVRLCSRAGRPWDVDPHSGDRRELGLKLHYLALGNSRDVRKVALDSPSLSQGFDRVERDNAGWTWRWTNGDALLHLTKLAPRRTVTVVEIAFDQALPMWVEPPHCGDHKGLVGAGINQAHHQR